MRILTRMCTSLDGFVTTPDGRPVQVDYPAWDPEELGFYELQSLCGAVLMGRTTFEPALYAPFWPWGDLPVYVLGSQLRSDLPAEVVVDSDPVRLYERLLDDCQDADVYLVGGPLTVETYRRLGVLDELRLMVLPVLTGAGRQLTPDIGTDAVLSLIGIRDWPGGVTELAYEVEY